MWSVVVGVVTMVIKVSARKSGRGSSNNNRNSGSSADSICCSIRFGSRSTRPTVACADDDESMDNVCGVIKRFQTGFYSMVIVTTRGRRLSLAIRSHTIAIPCGVAASHAHLHMCPCAICGVSCRPTVFTKHMAGFVNGRNLI